MNQNNWVKSTKSGIGNCVEIRNSGPMIDLRDSKNPEAGHISVPRAAFVDFVEDLKTGSLES